MRESVRERERERECVSERERERVCVSVSVSERECERERECVCVCVCVCVEKCPDVGNDEVPEDLFQEFDLVVWVFLGVLLLKEGSGVGHGPSIYLKQHMNS